MHFFCQLWCSFSCSWGSHCRKERERGRYIIYMPFKLQLSIIWTPWDVFGLAGVMLRFPFFRCPVLANDVKDTRNFLPYPHAPKRELWTYKDTRIRGLTLPTSFDNVLYRGLQKNTHWQLLASKHQVSSARPFQISKSHQSWIEGKSIAHESSCLIMLLV